MLQRVRLKELHDANLAVRQFTIPDDYCELLSRLAVRCACYFIHLPSGTDSQSCYPTDNNVDELEQYISGSCASQILRDLRASAKNIFSNLDFLDICSIELLLVQLLQISSRKSVVQLFI